MYLHLRRHPTSLAAAFLREYNFGSHLWRVYYNGSCAACVRKGFCQCYVPRAAALHDLLSRRRQRRGKAAEPLGGVPTIAPEDLVLGRGRQALLGHGSNDIGCPRIECFVCSDADCPLTACLVRIDSQQRSTPSSSE